MLVQIKAEAAAATSVKVELERQIESLRRQLADAQAGSTIHTAPSSISGEAADGASGAAAAAASGAARDAALLAAELRTTQVQLQHVMHERQAAHSLAEQHKSSAESLERHRDALGKTVTELRSAKEVRLLYQTTTSFRLTCYVLACFWHWFPVDSLSGVFDVISRDEM